MKGLKRVLVIMTAVFLLQIISNVTMFLYSIKRNDSQQSHKSENNIKNTLVLQNIDAITHKIIEREAIPSSLFEYDEELKNVSSDIRKYNELISYFSGYFTNKALRIFIGLFYIYDEDGKELPNDLQNYLKLPHEIREYATIVGKLALYENYRELIESHPQIGHIIEKEAGGSSGIWHRFLHNFEDDTAGKEKIEELFSLIPKLLNDLENIRAQTGTSYGEGDNDILDE